MSEDKRNWKMDYKKLGPCFTSTDWYFINDIYLNKCKSNIQWTFKNESLPIKHNSKAARDFMCGTELMETKEIETYEVIKI